MDVDTFVARMQHLYTNLAKSDPWMLRKFKFEF